MKKKLGLLILVTIVGLSILGTIVFLQTSALHSMISNYGVRSSEMSLAINQLEASLKKLQVSSAEAFLVKSNIEVDLKKDEAAAAIAELSKAVKELQSGRYEIFYAEPIEVKTTPEPTKITVSIGFQFLEKSTTELSVEVEKNLALAIEKIETLDSLEKSRNSLSKVYRASFALMKYDKDAYANLSRAVLTVLSTLMTRDINFAGRTLFADADKFYSAKKMAREDQEAYAKLKTVFVETQLLANKAGSMTSDFELFDQKLNEKLAYSTSLKQFSNQTQVQTQTATIERAAGTRSQAIIVSLLVIVFGVALGVWIARSLLKALQAVAINLESAGGQVNQTSGTLSQTSSQMAAGATQSAAAIEETVASMTEISATIQLNSKNAQECASLSVATEEIARQGQGDVASMIAAMHSISGSSKKISETIKSVDDIAFQINLLSLNAAVEAARAGEQGKGFAVVADAVRTLAQKSAAAAKEIGQLINESAGLINNGVALADRSDQSLQKVLDSIAQVSRLCTDIAEASREQANGVDQVNKALGELDKISQSNTSSAQETAYSSEGLFAQAAELDSAMTGLKHLIAS